MEKFFSLKILRSKNFKQKLRHQVAEEEEAKALRVEAGAIQKLPLPHPCYEPITNKQINNRSYKN